MGDLSNMVCLDIFLESLSQDEYLKVKDKFFPAKSNFHPLLSADICHAKHQGDLGKYAFAQDFARLQQFCRKYEWENDVKSILLENTFEALVLTDASEVIQWVNDGFTHMTGYMSDFALGKTPKFLQGSNTSKESQTTIKRGLEMKKPFTQTVLNYTVNNEEYRCSLNVFPLHNKKGDVVNFLALENKV